MTPCCWGRWPRQILWAVGLPWCCLRRCVQSFGDVGFISYLCKGENVAMVEEDKDAHLIGGDAEMVSLHFGRAFDRRKGRLAEPVDVCQDNTFGIGPWPP